MSKAKNPNSRWVRAGPVPRYSDAELSRIVNKYHPSSGWRNGARIKK